MKLSHTSKKIGFFDEQKTLFTNQLQLLQQPTI